MIFWTFLIKRYRVWSTYRATFAELNRLDDRILHDLNIGRSDIGRVARRAAQEAVA